MLSALIGAYALSPILLSAPDAGLEARLKGHIAFLASDFLAGRDTPSVELDIAAEYLASQFQAVGLEPSPNGTYFQETEYENRRAQTKGKVRNVVGVLPGSDPMLKGQYVLVTAHYDHLGKRGEEGDTTYNGANDNGSGTAGLIEVARLLQMDGAAPKRTVVFIAWWGEEKGLQGSRYYGENPVFPLKDTVAMVNLEQIGRTDDDEGPRVAEANLTGFAFSTVTDFFVTEGPKAGIKFTEHPTNSARYFTASDNAALAIKGIPAHTISVAYSFPDYHRPGDHWDKLHYPNYAKVVEACTAGIRALSNADSKPQWKEIPATQRFRDAHKALMGGGED